MKHIYIFAMLVVILILSGCKGDDPVPDTPAHYGRTVLVYMAMQNSLGSDGFQKNDSTELANAMSAIPENDRLLLFIDDVQNPRIYELNAALTTPKLLKRWATDVSSVSAATVTEVLEFMKTNYESDAYALVMESHSCGWLPTPTNYSAMSGKRVTEDAFREDVSTVSSNGPRRTFGIDVGPNGSMRNNTGENGNVADQLEIDDLASAISAAGIHLSYLLFDSCLMQNIEVDYALKDVTDYIIASPITTSVEGGYYSDLVKYGLFSSDANDVARTYISYYKGEGSVPYYDVTDINFYGNVISCVKTSALDNLAAVVKTILSEMTATATKNTDGQAVWTMDGALSYYTYCSNYYYRPHYYDMVSAFEAMGATTQQMSRLRDALDDAVTYHSTTSKFWVGPGYYTYRTMPTDDTEWCGVSMFVPQAIYTTNSVNCAYYDLNEDFKQTKWYEAVWK